MLMYRGPHLCTRSADSPCSRLCARQRSRLDSRSPRNTGSCGSQPCACVGARYACAVARCFALDENLQLYNCSTLSLWTSTFRSDFRHAHGGLSQHPPPRHIFEWPELGRSCSRADSPVVGGALRGPPAAAGAHGAAVGPGLHRRGARPRVHAPTLGVAVRPASEGTVRPMRNRPLLQGWICRGWDGHTRHPATNLSLSHPAPNQKGHPHAHQTRTHPPTQLHSCSRVHPHSLHPPTHTVPHAVQYSCAPPPPKRLPPWWTSLRLRP